MASKRAKAKAEALLEIERRVGEAAVTVVHLRISRRVKRVAVLAVVVALLFIYPMVFLRQSAPIEARHPGVRIDTPLRLVRGRQCLLTETKERCKQRFPAPMPTESPKKAGP